MSKKGSQNRVAVIYRIMDEWREHLSLLVVPGGYVLNQTRSEGSEQMLVYRSESFASGQGFWQAFDENAEYGGMEDDQLVMDCLDDIRSHSGKLASEIETELRRRQE